jgi:hypothetical protein
MSEWQGVRKSANPKHHWQITCDSTRQEWAEFKRCNVGRGDNVPITVDP